jgi:hypothetical protein
VAVETKTMSVNDTISTCNNGEVQREMPRENEFLLNVEHKAITIGSLIAEKGDASIENALQKDGDSVHTITESKFVNVIVDKTKVSLDDITTVRNDDKVRRIKQLGHRGIGIDDNSVTGTTKYGTIKVRSIETIK